MTKHRWAAHNGLLRCSTCGAMRRGRKYLVPLSGLFTRGGLWTVERPRCQPPT